MKTETLSMYKIISFFLRGMNYEFGRTETGITTKFSTFEDPIVEMIEDGSNGRSFGKKPRENNCWTLSKIDHHIILINFKLFIPGETKSCLFFEYKDNGTLEIWHRRKSGLESNSLDDEYITHTFEKEEKIMQALRAFEDAFTNKDGEKEKVVNRASIEKFWEKTTEIRGLKEQSQN